MCFEISHVQHCSNTKSTSDSFRRTHRLYGGDIEVVKVGSVEDMCKVVRLAVAPSEPMIPLSILSLVLCLSGKDQQKKNAALSKKNISMLPKRAGV